MSARQMKKLQQLIAKHDAADDDEEEELPTTMKSKTSSKKRQTIPNVGEQGTTDVKIANKKKDKPEEPAHAAVSVPLTTSGDGEQEVIAKKLKKSEQKQRRRAKEAEDDMLLDEVSRQSEQQSVLAASASASVGEQAHLYTEDAVLKLLEQCDPTKLDPRDEKIRKLGISAVESKDSNKSRDRANPYMRGVGKLPTFRNSPFATPDKYTWPPFAPLLALVAVPGAKASSKAATVTTYFVDGSGPENVKANERFDRCVKSFADVRTMTMECLAYAPYHLPTLLQLHTAFLVLGDNAQAQALLERALYAVGVLLARFPLSQPSSLRQLPYSDQRNQQVYLCLSRGIHHALKMGCAETAMGYCKLLASLDPTDPKSALLVMDYCALRGKEWSFLVACWPVMSRRLPGFAFHGALAKFLLEQEAAAPSDQSPSASSLTALEMLHDAAVLHPRAAALLCEKAELKLPSGSNLVAAADLVPSTPASDRVAKLFADRSFDLWKSREVQRFAVAAFTKACATCTQPSGQGADKLFAERSAVCTSTMIERYRGATSEDVLGETPTRIPAELLANFQRDDMVALQQQEDQQMIQQVQLTQYDADMFTRMEAAFGAMPGTFEERQAAYRERLAHYEHLVGQEFNPLALFLRTLLPGAASITEMAIQRALQDAGVADPVAARRAQQWQNDLGFWERQDEEARLREEAEEDSSSDSSVD